MSIHIYQGSGAPTITPTKLGQHYIDTTNGRAYISIGISTSSDWKLTNTPITYVTTFNTRSGNVTPQSGDYTAAQVGADPVGTATSVMGAHELDPDPHPGYILATQKGAVNGVCPLDSGSLIPSVYLPSFVDDVLEFSNFAQLPTTGETGKIYFTLNNGLQYRWSGSAYVQIIGSPGTTDSVPEGTTNLYFTDSRAIAVAPQGLLTGLDDTTQGDPLATDTILQAIGKMIANFNVWTELITTADLTNNSNVTLVNVAEHTLNVIAGHKYRIEMTFIFRSTANTAGCAITMGATGAAGSLALSARMASGNDGTTAIYEGAITSFGDVVTATSTPTANNDYIGNLQGVFVCTTGGTIYPQFRSETNGQTITIKTGSVMLAREF